MNATLKGVCVCDKAPRLPTPSLFFGTADSKGVTGVDSASADYTGVRGRQFRLKPAETRSWRISVQNKELTDVETRLIGKTEHRTLPGQYNTRVKRERGGNKQTLAASLNRNFT